MSSSNLLYIGADAVRDSGHQWPQAAAEVALRMVTSPTVLTQAALATLWLLIDPEDPDRPTLRVFIHLHHDAAVYLVASHWTTQHRAEKDFREAGQNVY
jgi:hypothetical protein